MSRGVRCTGAYSERRRTRATPRIAPAFQACSDARQPPARVAQAYWVVRRAARARRTQQMDMVQKPADKKPDIRVRMPGFSDSLFFPVYLLLRRSCRGRSRGCRGRSCCLLRSLLGSRSRSRCGRGRGLLLLLLGAAYERERNGEQKGEYQCECLLHQLFHLLLTFYPCGQLFSRVGLYLIEGGLSIKNIGG